MNGLGRELAKQVPNLVIMLALVWMFLSRIEQLFDQVSKDHSECHIQMQAMNTIQTENTATQAGNTREVKALREVMEAFLITFGRQ